MADSSRTGSHQHGFDPVLSMMRDFNIPVTRENYLDLAYLGQVPDPLSAEEEADLPPEIRSPRYRC